MNFEEYLKSYGQKLDQTLEAIFNEWRSTIKKVAPKTLPLLEAIIDGSEGGKRIRGVLVNLGYELISRKTDVNSLKAGGAYEIFQTAILAHDDIIDKSPLRRGRQTIYMALGGDHYGISQTISLSDCGFFQTFNIIASLDLPSENKTQAIKNFSETMTDTTFGQMLDVGFEKELEATEEDVLLMIKLKTARYTISGPLVLGANLAGGDQALINKLEKFGDDIGIAFQIQDDILGVFGVETQVGKSVTSDIEEGKKTLLYLYANKNANLSQRKILEKSYGQGEIDQKKVEEIKEVFIETGSLEYSQKLASQYIENGKKLIPEITKDKKYQQLLIELSDFVFKRQN